MHNQWRDSVKSIAHYKVRLCRERNGKEQIVNKDLHIGAVNRNLHKSAAARGRGGREKKEEKLSRMDLNVV